MSPSKKNSLRKNREMAPTWKIFLGNSLEVVKGKLGEQGRGTSVASVVLRGDVWGHRHSRELKLSLVKPVNTTLKAIRWSDPLGRKIVHQN